MKSGRCLLFLPFTRRLLPVLGLVLMLPALPACATKSVSVKFMAPGSIDLKGKGINSLAVSDFDGPEDSGRKIAELFIAKLAQGRYFKVVERDKLLAMEKEQAL